jgi:hypothetical protein
MITHLPRTLHLREHNDAQKGLEDPNSIARFGLLSGAPLMVDRVQHEFQLMAPHSISVFYLGWVELIIINMLACARSGKSAGVFCRAWDRRIRQFLESLLTGLIGCAFVLLGPNICLWRLSFTRMGLEPLS